MHLELIDIIYFSLMINYFTFLFTLRRRLLRLIATKINKQYFIYVYFTYEEQIKLLRIEFFFIACYVKSVVLLTKL